MSVAVDDLILHETRVRMRQALLAAAAGVLVLGASVVQLSGPQPKVSELTIDLITAHKRFPLDVIGSVINGAGLLAVAATLVYLFGAARARKPDLGPWVKLVALLGGVLAAVAGVGYSAVIAGKADQFVKHGLQTYEQANSLTSGGGIVALQLAGQGGALLLAMGFVLVALNAMRVGLLTRFMGYLGIFAGVLLLFPIVPVPIVQGFWLLAVAYLISGRWPSGLPPAWRSGQAEPWPSSAQLRGQRQGASRPAQRPKQAPAAKPAPETVGASAAARTRASTPKRKRKRRR